VLPEADEWPALAQVFPVVPSTRQIVVAKIERVQTSCGFGVPVYTYVAERDMHFKWASKNSAADLAEYQEKHNARSIDGLPTPLCVGL
jgi:hypothetical protein